MTVRPKASTRPVTEPSAGLRRRVAGSAAGVRGSVDRAVRRTALPYVRQTGLALLLRGLPARPHAVVHGIPDHEGNSTEVLRHLLTDYPGRVYWLVSDVSDVADDLTWELEDVDRRRLTIIKKDSFRAFRAYLTAELVFFTHGLYGSPVPPSSRTFVNLWHGDGPKRTGNVAFDAKVPSTLLIAGTTEFGKRKAAGLGVSADRLAVTGNPRIDQFSRPPSDAQMQALGLSVDRPLLIWAPTYRASAGGGGLAWDDSSRLTAQAQNLKDMQEAAQELYAAGGQLIVKPHMLDADNFRQSGLTVVVDAQLVAAKVSFYRLLGCSAGLVTDYSSIWTDYLTLQRPIGYFCPDLEDYQRGRGFNIDDFREWLAGPLLRDGAALSEFLQQVLAGQDPGAAERDDVATRLGAVTQLGATARVLRATGHSAFRG
jgi:CDP-glycerol glycerophosphotransferase